MAARLLRLLCLAVACACWAFPALAEECVEEMSVAWYYGQGAPVQGDLADLGAALDARVVPQGPGPDGCAVLVLRNEDGSGPQWLDESVLHAMVKGLWAEDFNAACARDGRDPEAWRELLSALPYQVTAVFHDGYVILHDDFAATDYVINVGQDMARHMLEWIEQEQATGM